MNERLTDELLVELTDSPSLDTFLANNQTDKVTLSQYLQDLLVEKGMRRIDVIHAADLNETFGYQIFTGERGASRDKILQIAFAMHLTLEETNHLLRAAGASGLYCKNRRDAIIIFCLTHNASLQEANEELYRFDEDTIC